MFFHDCEASAASERAQRAKRAEHAIQEAFRYIHDGKINPKGCHSELLKRTALPVPMSVRFILGGWFFEPRRAKTHPRCAQTRPRRAKTRQDAPSGAQDGPKTPQEATKRRQDAPKTPQDAPRAAQDGQNDAKIDPIWHQNRIKNRCLFPKAVFSKIRIKPMQNQ